MSYAVSDALAMVYYLLAEHLTCVQQDFLLKDDLLQRIGLGLMH